MEKLKQLEEEMLASEDKQLSLTDPDARSMMTSGRGTGMVGYNVQTSIDAKHHLIIDLEVTQTGLDNGQLAKMVKSTKEAIGVDDLTVVADRGYYEGEQIRACDKAGITAFLPKPLTSGSKAKRRFSKQDYLYLADEHVYRCPADEKLTWRFKRVERGKMLHRYWTTACAECALKEKCTTPPWRRISRWEHEAVLEAAQRRLDLDPEKMAVRRCTAEHPFGTLKAWMGATHFLTRTMGRVSAEMSLHVLAYNMKRMIKIMGFGPLLEAIQAYGEALMALLCTAMASVSLLGRFPALFVITVPKSAPG